MFDVPAQLLRSAPSDPHVTVSLTDDPSVTANGRVREVAPQADPVTRTFQVKVGLTDPPAAMRLGATVTGRMEMEADTVISIPASALTELNSSPRSGSSIRPGYRVTAQYRGAALRAGDGRGRHGVDTGDIVVTAGVQALHPGQKVRILGPQPSGFNLPSGRSPSLASSST